MYCWAPWHRSPSSETPTTGYRRFLLRLFHLTGRLPVRPPCVSVRPPTPWLTRPAGATVSAHVETHWKRVGGPYLRAGGGRAIERSSAAFAGRHGIKPATLNWWRSELRKSRGGPRKPVSRTTFTPLGGGVPGVAAQKDRFFWFHPWRRIGQSGVISGSYCRGRRASPPR